MILNYAAFVHRELVAIDHPAREDVEEIRSAAERAAYLTRSLLLFSQQEASSSVTDVNAVIEDFEVHIRRALGEDVRVSTALSPRAPKAAIERVALEQILMNLAVNSRDAMPGGGSLTIATERVGRGAARRLRLTIADTGAGMTEDVRDHALEPFFTTKPTGSGTGLGLATVYGIVKACDGQLSIDSAPGRGTTITIELPAVAAGDDSDSLPSLPEQSDRRETVLIVEDNRAVGRLTARILGDAGFDVLLASSGPEAIEAASGAGRAIDLVLADMVMPEMSGPEAAERLKVLAPDASVIFMSGYSDSPNRLPAGARLIKKPFTAEALVQELRSVLAGAGAP